MLRYTLRPQPSPEAEAHIATDMIANSIGVVSSCITPELGYLRGCSGWAGLILRRRAGDLLQRSRRLDVSHL